MKFPPFYRKTEKIIYLLTQFDSLKQEFEEIPISQQTMLSLQRKAILKSSLFSARIEGNPLTLSDVTPGQLERPRSLHTQELSNIARAIGYVQKGKVQRLNDAFARKLHAMVMAGISSEAGRFRTEESAIFNQAGIAVYLAPAPKNFNQLLSDLFNYCNSSKDPAPIVAAVAHIWFEKIHPFTDGNGRVGRLLSSSLLTAGSYGFAGIVPFEEYLDAHRQDYYDAVGHDAQDVTTFIEFFLQALVAQANKSHAEIKAPLEGKQSNLLPRRQEILNIIRDHQMVSFDFLARRFRAVPPSTLHYDLKQLLKSGLVKKLGTTRGAVYCQSR